MQTAIKLFLLVYTDMTMLCLYANDRVMGVKQALLYNALSMEPHNH